MADGYWYEIAALGRYGRQPYDVVRGMRVNDRHRLYQAVKKLVEAEAGSGGGDGFGMEDLD
ncbi:MAG: hypothetical protein WC700_18410 [Gemmatimonadaceae bacterium]|jgi:hypothetical protein